MYPTLIYVGTVASGITIHEVAERVERIFVGSKQVRVDDASVKPRHLANAYPYPEDLPTG
jgi:hypothetical protein